MIDRKNSFAYQSPIGLFSIEYQDSTILKVQCTKDHSVTQKCTNSFETLVKTQLDEYFLGKRKDFDLNFEFKDATAFEMLVYKRLALIPFGKTITYGQIAKDISNPKAYRAVATACRKNPILIFIPCHRVILASGDIGKYILGKEAKRQLLNLESSNIFSNNSYNP